MAREMDAAVILELFNSTISNAALIELYFDSQEVRFSTLPYDMTLNGYQYIGVGNLGEVQVLNETTDVQSLAIQFSLSGVNREVVQFALAESYQGRRATFSVVFFDENGIQIADPVLLLDGRMDYMDVNMGKEATVLLTIETKLVEWEKAKVSRYNSSQQKARYPLDCGLDFIEDMETLDIPWGIEK